MSVPLTKVCLKAYSYDSTYICLCTVCHIVPFTRVSQLVQTKRLSLTKGEDDVNLHCTQTSVCWLVTKCRWTILIDAHYKLKWTFKLLPWISTEKNNNKQLWKQPGNKLSGHKWFIAFLLFSHTVSEYLKIRIKFPEESKHSANKLFSLICPNPTIQSLQTYQYMLK